MRAHSALLTNSRNTATQVVCRPTVAATAPIWASTHCRNGEKQSELPLLESASHGSATHGVRTARARGVHSRRSPSRSCIMCQGGTYQIRAPHPISDQALFRTKLQGGTHPQRYLWSLLVSRNYSYVRCTHAQHIRSKYIHAQRMHSICTASTSTIRLYLPVQLLYEYIYTMTRRQGRDRCKKV